MITKKIDKLLAKLAIEYIELTLEVKKKLKQTTTIPVKVSDIFTNNKTDFLKLHNLITHALEVVAKSSKPLIKSRIKPIQDILSALSAETFKIKDISLTEMICNLLLNIGSEHKARAVSKELVNIYWTHLNELSLKSFGNKHFYSLISSTFLTLINHSSKNHKVYKPLPPKEEFDDFTFPIKMFYSLCQAYIHSIYRKHALAISYFKAATHYLDLIVNDPMIDPDIFRFQNMTIHLNGELRSYNLRMSPEVYMAYMKFSEPYVKWIEGRDQIKQTFDQAQAFLEEKDSNSYSSIYDLGEGLTLEYLSSLISPELATHENTTLLLDFLEMTAGIDSREKMTLPPYDDYESKFKMKIGSAQQRVIFYKTLHVLAYTYGMYHIKLLNDDHVGAVKHFKKAWEYALKAEHPQAVRISQMQLATSLFATTLFDKNENPLLSEAIGLFKLLQRDETDPNLSVLYYIMLAVLHLKKDSYDFINYHQVLTSIKNTLNKLKLKTLKSKQPETPLITDSKDKVSRMFSFLASDLEKFFTEDALSINVKKNISTSLTLLAGIAHELEYFFGTTSSNPQEDMTRHLTLSSAHLKLARYYLTPDFANMARAQHHLTKILAITDKISDFTETGREYLIDEHLAHVLLDIPNTFENILKHLTEVYYITCAELDEKNDDEHVGMSSFSKIINDLINIAKTLSISENIIETLEEGYTKFTAFLEAEKQKTHSPDFISSPIAATKAKLNKKTKKLHKPQPLDLDEVKRLTEIEYTKLKQARAKKVAENLEYVANKNKQRLHDKIFPFLSKMNPALPVAIQRTIAIKNFLDNILTTPTRCYLKGSVATLITKAHFDVDKQQPYQPSVKINDVDLTIEHNNPARVVIFLNRYAREEFDWIKELTVYSAHNPNNHDEIFYRCQINKGEFDITIPTAAVTATPIPLLLAPKILITTHGLELKFSAEESEAFKHEHFDYPKIDPKKHVKFSRLLVNALYKNMLYYGDKIDIWGFKSSIQNLNGIFVNLYQHHIERFKNKISNPQFRPGLYCYLEVMGLIRWYIADVDNHLESKDFGCLKINDKSIPVLSLFIDALFHALLINQPALRGSISHLTQTLLTAIKVEAKSKSLDSMFCSDPSDKATSWNSFLFCKLIDQTIQTVHPDYQPTNALPCYLNRLSPTSPKLSIWKPEAQTTPKNAPEFPRKAHP